jgi:2-methylcitrate dehydratase PrpD
MANQAKPGVTRALIESVRSLRHEDVPEDAREVARHCLLDFLGCAVAGAREPLVEILVDSVVSADESKAASLIGRSERASRLTAALINGAAGHALDFDDAHMAMSGHPSVPVLPALLALAETESTDGRRFLAAMVAGIELECRLGALLGDRHYEVGFHSTGTIGTFGAAAAAAHLLDLDEDGWLRALGLAGTEAAGLKSAFGTMAKPLHAGRAASAGLLAALLARRGFTAAADVIEAKQGFAETHAGATPDITRLDRLSGRFLIRETLFKYHAACYLTHAAIEAARRLREQHRMDATAIDSVEVTVAPSLLSVCNIAEPRTGLEGKFSLRATTALALLGEDTGALETYSDAKISDPGLVRLRDRVRIVTDASLVATRARVAVTLGTRRFEDEADTGVPATDLAEQRRRLQAKFRALAVPRLGEQKAADVAEAALRIDQPGSLHDLLRCLDAPPAPAPRALR